MASAMEAAADTVVVVEAEVCWARFALAELQQDPAAEALEDHLAVQSSMVLLAEAMAPVAGLVQFVICSPRFVHDALHATPVQVAGLAVDQMDLVVATAAAVELTHRTVLATRLTRRSAHLSLQRL